MEHSKTEKDNNHTSTIVDLKFSAPAPTEDAKKPHDFLRFFCFVFNFFNFICCHFLHHRPSFRSPRCRRVEDRNDPMLQKMRRYIKAFSKEEEGKEDKTDTLKGSQSGTPQLRHKNRGGFNNRRSLTGWQMIRHSALGLEFGNEELEDEQDIKYV